MNCTLVGFKSLNFTDAEGNKVEGVKLFLAYPDDDVIGCAADSSFIRQNVFDKFGITLDKLANAVDCAVDVEYDRKGKTVGLKVL